MISTARIMIIIAMATTGAAVATNCSSTWHAHNQMHTISNHQHISLHSAVLNVQSMATNWRLTWAADVVVVVISSLPSLATSVLII